MPAPFSIVQARRATPVQAAIRRRRRGRARTPQCAGRNRDRAMMVSTANAGITSAAHCNSGSTDQVASGNAGVLNCNSPTRQRGFRPAACRRQRQRSPQQQQPDGRLQTTPASSRHGNMRRAPRMTAARPAIRRRERSAGHRQCRGAQLRQSDEPGRHRHRQHARLGQRIGAQHRQPDRDRQVSGDFGSGGNVGVLQQCVTDRATLGSGDTPATANVGVLNTGSGLTGDSGSGDSAGSTMSAC